MTSGTAKTRNADAKRLEHVGADVAAEGCLVCEHRDGGGDLDGCGWVPIGRICLDCLALFAGRMCGIDTTGGQPPGGAARPGTARGKDHDLP